MKIYLSGPMRGFKSANFPAFDFAANKLRAEGNEVFSPADNDRAIMGWSASFIPSDEDLDKATALTVRRCFETDMTWICRHAQAIVVLPGSDDSTGVAAEVALARAIGIPVRHLGEEYTQ